MLRGIGHFEADIYLLTATSGQWLVIKDQLGDKPSTCSKQDSIQTHFFLAPLVSKVGIACTTMTAQVCKHRSAYRYVRKMALISAQVLRWRLGEADRL